MRKFLLLLLVVGCSVEPQFDEVSEQIEEGYVSYASLQKSSEVLGRGEYLYRIAGCESCHSSLNIQNASLAANAIRAKHDGYKWMSESDLLSILAFLGADSSRVDREKLEEVSPGVRPDIVGSYGPYLYKSVVNCERCHGETVDDIDDLIETMSKADVAQFLRSGSAKTKADLCGGIQAYTDEDLKSLASYIVTLN